MKSGIVIPSEIQHKSVLYGAQSFDPFFQIKAVNDDKGIIQAYASKFDNVDEYKDVVLKGAYLRTLKNQRLSSRKYLYVYLFQHDPNLIVGGIAEAEEDKFGLLYQAQCNLDTQLGRETYSNAKMGVLYQSSIGYDVPTGGAEYKDGIRYLKEIRLWEISLVTFAANPEATVLGVKQSQLSTPYEIQPTPSEESQRELEAELPPQATITSVKSVPDEDENASLETPREEKSFIANYQEYVAMDFWEDWHCLLLSALNRSVCDAFLGPDPLLDMQETLREFSRAAMQWANSAQAAGLQGYLQEMTATFNTNYEEMSAHRDMLRKAGRTFSSSNAERINAHAKSLHSMADKAMLAIDDHCKTIRAAADDLASMLPGSNEEETDEGSLKDQPKDEKAVSLDLAHGAIPHSEASTVDEQELEAFLQDLRGLTSSTR